MVNAYNDSSYARILTSVKAILFFGTPHRGADLSAIMSKLLVVSFSRKVFVDQLRWNSLLIKEINDSFRDRSTSFELVSYYECRGIPGVGVLSTT